MYSKYSYSRAPAADADFLPARYSGVRFRREKRSDGREEIGEAPFAPSLYHESGNEKAETVNNGETDSEHSETYLQIAGQPREIQEKSKPSFTEKLSSIFGNIGEDDILIAALIIILAGENNDDNREAILLLALLLCIR